MDGYRADVLTFVMLAVEAAPDTPHSDEGVVALSGALVLIVGWVLGGVVLYRRARRRSVLPPGS